MSLSSRRESFCQQFVVDMNATAAAARAGYSQATAKQQGSRLLTNVDVKARVAELQAGIAERCEVSVDSVVAELEEARSQAIATGQASAAVSASLGKAKVCGLLLDRFRDESGGTPDAEIVRGIAVGDAPLAASLIFKLTGFSNSDELVDQVAGDDKRQAVAIRAALAKLKGGTRH